MIEFFLVVLGIYLLAGVVFAIPFVLVGARRVDPAAQQATWGFRLIILPGAAILWPLMLTRWIQGRHPIERSAHRRAARQGK